MYSNVRQGSVLISTLSGVTNPGHLTHYFADMRKAVEQFEGRPWGCLLDLRDWQMGGPDIAQVATDIHRWNLAHNMTAVAFVFGEASPSIQSWALSNYVEEHGEFIRERFFTLEAAKKWLAMQGFESDTTAAKSAENAS